MRHSTKLVKYAGRLTVLCGLLGFASLTAAQPTSAPLEIKRLSGSIRIDGDLSDDGWQNAVRIDTWYETNPRDNVQLDGVDVGWLTYDDKYFYVALQFNDPNPGEIRAPFGDHDNLTSSHDYGGIFIDADNDGKTALLFLTTARGV